MTKYAKSFLNYPGGKYKLIDVLLSYFPTKVDYFIDLFTGSGVVSENYNGAYSYIANDSQINIINLQKYLKNHSYPQTLQIINKIIKNYNLSNTSLTGYCHYYVNSSQGLSYINKHSYLKLRSDYVHGNFCYPKELMLYVLIVYGFNNQVRFNRKGEFNNPVGKRDFNKSMQNKISTFIDIVRKKNIYFTSKDFRNIDIIPNSFIYADPPYLITTAVYNENGRWNEQDDQDLMKYLDQAQNMGVKFALSNVFQHKGKYNDKLIQWAQKYNIYHINNDYSNSNYHTRKLSSDEVLITNY